jgi:hypothetical protein
LAGLVALAILHYRHWRKIFWKGKGDTASSDAIEQPRTSLQWQQQAFAFEEEGNFAEACRALHRACLQSFDGAHILAFAPARSNYEYAVAISSKPSLRDLRSPFQAFSHSVDGIYFGNRPASAADFQFCRRSLQIIEEKLASIAPRTSQ